MIFCASILFVFEQLFLRRRRLEASESCGSRANELQCSLSRRQAGSASANTRVRAREQPFGSGSASHSLLRNGSAAYYPCSRQQRFEFKPVLSHGNNRLIHLPCSISTLAAGRADSQGSALCVLQVIVAKDARGANSSQRSRNDDAAPPPPRGLLRRVRE